MVAHRHTPHRVSQLTDGKHAALILAVFLPSVSPSRSLTLAAAAENTFFSFLSSIGMREEPGMPSPSKNPKRVINSWVAGEGPGPASSETERERERRVNERDRPYGNCTDNTPATATQSFTAILWNKHKTGITRNVMIQNSNWLCLLFYNSYYKLCILFYRKKLSILLHLWNNFPLLMTSQMPHNFNPSPSPIWYIVYNLIISWQMKSTAYITICNTITTNENRIR